MEVFDNNGVSFVSVTQSFNTTSSMGRLTLNILLSFAQFEREIIGERIRDKVAAAKKKGKFTGGTPPLGYDVDPARTALIVNPEEAATVRLIFRRFAELGSALQVADELNRKGMRTKSWLTKKGTFREGKPWHKMHIYRTLHNRTYLGEVMHKDQTYPGEHERIVSKSAWDRAHAVIADNTSTRAKHARAKQPALLRGIIRCGVCDRAMSPVSTQSKGKLYRYYTCGTASKSGHAACPVRSIAAGEIEGAVMMQLRAVFQSPEMIAQTALAVRELELESGETGIPMTSESQIREALMNIDSVWEELYPAEQTRIVRLLVKSVTVMPDGISVAIHADGMHSLVSELNSNGDSSTESRRQS